MKTTSQDHLGHRGALHEHTMPYGAILCSAVAGLTAAIVMGLLGAALGITVGAAVVDSTSGEGAAASFATGFAIWTLLTAIASGVVGGLVLRRTLHAHETQHRSLEASLSWAIGIVGLMLISAPGAGGILGMLGGGAASLAGVRMQGDRAGVEYANGQFVGGASYRSNGNDLTAEERAQAQAAADTAAKAAAASAWMVLISMACGLIATVVTAKAGVRPSHGNVVGSAVSTGVHGSTGATSGSMGVTPAGTSSTGGPGATPSTGTTPGGWSGTVPDAPRAGR